MEECMDSQLFEILNSIQGDVTDIKVDVGVLKNEMPHKVKDTAMAEHVKRENDMHIMAFHTSKVGVKNGFWASLFGDMNPWQKTILLVLVIATIFGNGKMVIDKFIG